MLSIADFRCQGLSAGCVTDEKNPVFSFISESDRANVSLGRKGRFSFRYEKVQETESYPQRNVE